ncbi:MAG: XisI protein [Phaeodactylibacter sp.]|nr:XisI protein [Phaeodactylibacter sp.]
MKKCYQIIIDKERNHFQLMRVGWDKDDFVHDCIMHFSHNVRLNGKKRCPCAPTFKKPGANGHLFLLLVDPFLLYLRADS